MAMRAGVLSLTHIPCFGHALDCPTKSDKPASIQTSLTQYNVRNAEGCDCDDGHANTHAHSDHTKEIPVTSTTVQTCVATLLRA